MKRFWNWMGDALNGVTINLDKVQPLPRTLSEDGDPNRQFDPKRDLKKKSPPEIELGHALVTARSGVLPDWAQAVWKRLSSPKNYSGWAWSTST
jgi:hypothetical protein